MFDLDKWKEIWATLRSNRLRTFLTAFGVFWGIVMLMAMLVVRLERCRRGMQRQMKGMATNLMFCWGQTTTEAYDGLPPGRAGASSIPTTSSCSASCRRSSGSRRATSSAAG